MKLTKLITLVSAMMLMLGVSNFSLASTHDDDNPNTFIYDRCMYNSASEIVAESIPSVVYIFMERMLDTGSDEFGGLMPSLPQPSNGVGTGFFINDEGYIVTNAHVVENSSSLKIYYWESPLEYGEAEIIGIDKIADIAVIKIDPEGPTKFVEWGDSDNVEMGDEVIAIGHGLSMPWAVTKGIISYIDRQPDKSKPMITYNQSDTVINQGNSGGPLFNLKGEVIGINTAIIAPGQSGSIGIGFAIPANAASNVINQLIEFGETKRGWLGVRIQDVTKEIAEVEKLKKPEGALVASVGQNSPADKAGIKAGDIILEFDGKKIDTMRTLPKVVASTAVGKSVQLKIWRNKKSITKRLVLGRLESSEEFKEKKTKTVKKEKEIESLKITVRDVTKDDITSRRLRKNTSGAVILDISSRSPLVNLLSINDIIIEVQKKPVKNSIDLDKIVESIFKKGEKTLLLTVINSQNQRRYLGVKIN